MAFDAKQKVDLLAHPTCVRVDGAGARIVAVDTLFPAAEHSRILEIVMHFLDLPWPSTRVRWTTGFRRSVYHLSAKHRVSSFRAACCHEKGDASSNNHFLTCQARLKFVEKSSLYSTDL